MKKVIMFVILCFMFGSCVSTPKRVDVAYFDYGDEGIFQHLYWFQGDLYEESFYIFKGVVIVDKYLGEGGFKFRNGVKNPERVKEGWYSVHIPDSLGYPDKQAKCEPGYCGDYILHGQGFGDAIFITPNNIPQKHLKRITKNK